MARLPLPRLRRRAVLHRGRDQLTVRLATAADAERILELIHELFEPPGGPPNGFTDSRGHEGVAYALENDNADILLAVDGDAIVGLATVYKDYFSIRDGWRTWLQDLVVASERRGRGVGKALLDAAANWAREHGCTHLDLASGLGREAAHRFYGRQGMRKGSYTFRLYL